MPSFFHMLWSKKKKKITENSYVLVLEGYLSRFIDSQTLRIITVARLGTHSEGQKITPFSFSNSDVLLSVVLESIVATNRLNRS